MSELRNQRDEISAALTALEKDICKSNIHLAKLHESKNLLGVQIILEEKLLSASKWFFEDRSKMCLVAQDSQAMKPICSMLVDPGWGHSTVDLTSDIYLSINDGEVSLGFSNPDAIKAFIKNQNLDVSFSNIEESVSKLQTKLDSLKEFLK